MPEEELEEGEGAEEEAPPPKGKKKLIIIIVAVVVVLGAVAGVLLAGGGGSEEEGEHGEVEHEAHYGQVEMDQFIVNLSSTASFLRVKLLLKYDEGVVMHGAADHGGGGGGGGHGGGDEGASLPGILGEREAMIRHAIIMTLSGKTAEDLLTPSGKEQLHEELLESINEATESDEEAVVDLFFIDFIIQ